MITKRFGACCTNRLKALICSLILSSNISAFEVDIDGLTYDLTGTSATVLHVAKGNQNSTIEIPSTISYEGLTYIVNTIGESCFVNACYFNWSAGEYRCYTNGGFQTLDIRPYFYFFLGDGKRYPDTSLVVNNSYVKKIILPCTIQTIHSGAFSNNNLIEIEQKEGIQTIGAGAFRGSSITQLTLFEGLKTIGSAAFANTKLKELTIPSTVTSIGTDVFTGSDLLRKLVYLGNQPAGWMATTTTYVPDNTWTNPASSINDAHIIPMIQWNNTQFDYTGTTPSITWTNNMEGYQANLRMPTLHKDAGTWKDSIPITFIKGSEELKVKAVCQYTINKVALTATVANATRPYGDENPIFRVSYTGFVNGESESVFNELPENQRPQLSTTATQRSGIGTYPISFSSGDLNNYTISSNPGTLTITKAPLTLIAEDKSREYGDNNPTFTYITEGLKNGETTPQWNVRPQLQTDAKPNSNAGKYEINIEGGETNNYEVIPKTGVLTITKASLSIKVNNASRIYGEENPDFTYVMQGKKQQGSDVNWVTEPSFITEAKKTTPVGTYKVSIQGQLDNPNYEVTKEDGELTINKRSLSVSTPDYSRVYGEENPVFEVSYGTAKYNGVLLGFAEGEDESALTSKPTIVTTATTTSDVGSYKLQLSGGEATNYSFVDYCGTLTITQAEQTLTWEQEINEMKKFSQVELTAQASSGLEVTYTITEGGDKANIYSVGSKTFLETVGNGEIAVVAQQKGNKNYYASPRIYKTIKVMDSKTVMLTLKDSEKGRLREILTSGETRQIAILPANNYKIHSVTFDDEDVTDQISDDNIFTTPAITENVTLYVVFESEFDAINTMRGDSRVRISAQHGAVVVNNLERGKQILVFDLEGRAVANQASDGSKTLIRLPEDQTYIVKAGEKVVKVQL